MFFTTALLLAGAGLASAQGLSSLSSQCQRTLAQVATNSEFSCLNLPQLLPLFTSPDSSVISPVDQWLISTCATAPCTNTSLSDLVTAVAGGCATDLQLNASTSTSGLIATVQQYYPLVRRVACLKDNAASQLCVTEDLTTIQSATTTLTVNSLTNIFSQLMAGQSAGIPTSVDCNTCAQAAYVIVESTAPGLISASAAQQQCGANFTSGGFPSTIQETATNSSGTTTTNAAAALSMNSLGLTALVLLVVSSAFTFFA